MFVRSSTLVVVVALTLLCGVIASSEKHGNRDVSRFYRCVSLVEAFLQRTSQGSRELNFDQYIEHVYAQHGHHDTSHLPDVDMILQGWVRLQQFAAVTSTRDHAFMEKLSIDDVVYGVCESMNRVRRNAVEEATQHAGDESLSEESWEDEQRSPEQVHLMLDGASLHSNAFDRAVLMWVTQEDTGTVVEIDELDGSNIRKVNGTSYTYDVGILGGWHGYIHRVEVSNLPLGVTFRYRVGDGVHFSEMYSFTTDTGSPVYPSRFAVAGDMGTVIPLGFDVAQHMIEQHRKTPFLFSFLIGDLCYAGTGGHDEWEPIWDMYGHQMEPLSTDIPFVTGVGNHEKYYNFTAFRARYEMPGDQSSGRGNFWFSIDRGPFHVTVMSTEHDFSVGSEQYEWIKRDLASANARRSQRPWIIFAGHRPMYASDLMESDQARPGAPLQSAIEPLLLQYQVDFAVYGHHHLYEAVHPVINGTIVTQPVLVDGVRTYKDPRAPVHVVQGTGGAFTLPKWQEPSPDWSASRNGHYGFGLVEVENAKTLSFRFYRLNPYEISDEFRIVKS